MHIYIYMHTTGILKSGRINAKLSAVVHLGRDKGLKHKLSLSLIWQFQFSQQKFM